MKKIIIALATLALASCANLPLKTPQDYFDAACRFGAPLIPKAQSLVATSTAHWSGDERLAAQSALTLIQTTCAAPLDLTDSAAITQRVYDAAGQVLALVIKAQP